MDKEFMARMKAEVDTRLALREAETTEYWLARLTEAYDRRHTNLAGLQVELRTLQEKMRTRLKVLRSQP